MTQDLLEELTSELEIDAGDLEGLEKDEGELLEVETLEPQLEAGSTPIHFTASREVLHALLAKVSPMVGKGTRTAVMGNFLFELQGNTLACVATDLELGMIALTEEISMKQEGIVQLPHDRLSRIVSLAGPDVEIISDGPTCTVITDGTEFVLPTVDVDIYPEVRTLASQDILIFDRDVLMRALTIALPAASKDESRPSMNMIHLNGLGAYATDSTRAHFVSGTWSEVDELDIPLVAIRPLIDLMKLDSGASVFCEIQDSHLIWRIGQDTFSIRRLDAAFPDVQNLLIGPRMATHAVQMVVSRERLNLVIRRALSMVVDGSKDATITMRLSTDEMVVKAAGTGNFDSSSVVEISYAGSPRTLMFSSGSLRDLINASDSEMVLMRLNPDADEGSALYVADNESIIGVILSRTAS